MVSSWCSTPRLTESLRAEGDARELARAIQELRREAELELDDRIELWVQGVPVSVAAYLPQVADDTLAELRDGEMPGRRARGRPSSWMGGRATLALRRLGLSAMTARAARSATRGRARWPIFIGLAATVFIVDQLTKAWLVVHVVRRRAAPDRR